MQAVMQGIWSIMDKNSNRFLDTSYFHPWQLFLDARLLDPLKSLICFVRKFGSLTDIANDSLHRPIFSHSMQKYYFILNWIELFKKN